MKHHRSYRRALRYILRLKTGASWTLLNSSYLIQSVNFKKLECVSYSSWANWTKRLEQSRPLHRERVSYRLSVSGTVFSLLRKMACEPIRSKGQAVPYFEKDWRTMHITLLPRARNRLSWPCFQFCLVQKIFWLESVSILINLTSWQ